MTWMVCSLTWNNAAALRRTLDALYANVAGDFDLLVRDNGSDDSRSVVESVAGRGRVVRGSVNLGAGGGLSSLMSEALLTKATHFLYLEDDWTLLRALSLAGLETLLEPAGTGQVRLSESPPPWRYGLGEDDAAESARQAGDVPRERWAHGEYQRVKLLWTGNPSAFTRRTAERFLLTGMSEYPMSLPYLRSEFKTVVVYPGFFRHEGVVKRRRGESGWLA